MRALSSLVLPLADAAVVSRQYDDLSLRQLTDHRRDVRSRFDRSALWMATVLRWMPGGRTILARGLQHVGGLPWPDSKLEVLDHGSVGTVYRLWRDGQPLVLKTYRHSLGRPLADQLALLDVHRREHELAAAWFNRHDQIVVPALYLVVNGPLLGLPVAAALQPYVTGTKQDVLSDFTDEELIARFARHRDLRRQFLDFAETTVDCFHDGELCHDFLGRHNLMLVTDGWKSRLRIVDGGLFELDRLRRLPHRYEALRTQIDRLARLVAGAGGRVRV